MERSQTLLLVLEGTMASWVIPPREPVLHEWNEVGQLVNGHVQRLLWECRVNRNGWGGRMCFS